MAKRWPTSRKRSGASSSSPAQPEPLVFFIDRSLGKKKVADALRAVGAQVKVHDQEFQQTTPDADWLTEVGRHGWVVLTKDQGIRYSELERRALMMTRTRCFVLVARDVTGDDIANIFTAARAKMERMCAQHRGPFIAKVYRDGAVTMWFEQPPRRR